MIILVLSIQQTNRYYIITKKSILADQGHTSFQVNKTHFTSFIYITHGVITTCTAQVAAFGLRGFPRSPRCKWKSARTVHDVINRYFPDNVIHRLGNKGENLTSWLVVIRCVGFRGLTVKWKHQLRGGRTVDICSRWIDR
jgi:hypothetical protein